MNLLEHNNFHSTIESTPKSPKAVIPKLNWFSDFTNNFSLFKRDKSEFLLNQNPKTNLFLVYHKFLWKNQFWKVCFWFAT